MVEKNKNIILSLSQPDSERIGILKVIFTLMVLFIHSYSEEVTFAYGNVYFKVPVWLGTFKSIVSQCISRCAVPGFFFLSAILLYRNPFTFFVFY